MANILLLEDDLILSGQIKEVLELDDHSVVSYATVPEAIDHIEAHPVELVIADIFIKGQDEASQQGGVTLISRIRQVNASDIPIIAISGGFVGSGSVHDSSPLVRQTAKTVGATAILAKPFAPQDLAGLIDILLSDPEAQD